jgi:hypothetical protein
MITWSCDKARLKRAHTCGTALFAGLFVFDDSLHCRDRKHRAFSLAQAGISVGIGSGSPCGMKDGSLVGTWGLFLCQKAVKREQVREPRACE